MIHKSVLLFGASGLVGSHVLTLLIKDLSVEKVVVFVRSPIQIDSPKVQVVLTDLKDLDQLNPYFISAETLLCCIGTTQKKVKTKEAFKAVDYDLPVNIAKKGFSSWC